jgi:hypothetical protein
LQNLRCSLDDSPPSPWNAAVTFAAGIVLVVAPAAVPRTVGIRIDPSAYLLCYVLAGAEFSLAVLSWAARTIADKKALYVIVTALIVLHATSGLLEIRAFATGAVNGGVLINAAFRLLVVVLLGWFGLRALSMGDADGGRY